MKTTRYNWSKIKDLYIYIYICVCGERQRGGDRGEI